jgi:hypothetical protein
MPSTLSKPLGVRVPHAQLQALQALAQRLGTTRGALASEALLRGLALLEQEHDGRRAPKPEPFDLASFAALVLEAARKSRTGRFGEDRVFIHHAWKQFHKLHRSSGLDEEGFKQKLLDANRARLLSLVRADLAPLLNRADVEASEIRYLSASFHFLCI